MANVVHDIPPFFKEHVPADVCEDLVIDGMRFFRADGPKLFDTLLGLARRGITVYPRELYSPRFLNALDQDQ